MPIMNNNTRKRLQQSSVSSASSVSSVSSGETDPSYHKSSRDRSKPKSIRHKSVFSGFWSDGEIEPDEKKKNKNSSSKSSKKKNNRNGSAIDYEGFYLTIGNVVYEIGVGDVVAMRNSVETDTGAADETSPTANSDGDESRELQKKRRLERTRDSAESKPEAIPSTDYGLDALSEQPSDYYKAIPQSIVGDEATNPAASPATAEKLAVTNATSSEKATAADASPTQKATVDGATAAANATVDATSEENSIVDTIETGKVTADTTPKENAIDYATSAEKASFGKNTPENPSANVGVKDGSNATETMNKASSAKNDGATKNTKNSETEKGSLSGKDVVPTGLMEGEKAASAGYTKEGAKDSKVGVSEGLPPQAPPSSETTQPSKVITAVTTPTTSPNKLPPLSLPPLKDAKVGDGLMLARVERIWQEKSGGGGRGSRNSSSGSNGSGGKVLFKARWFLKKEDVDSLPLGVLTGPVSSDVFAANITEHDLVLSNQSDDNHVTTICDLIQVLYRNPDLDAEIPSFVLPATYLCRYSLRIDDDSRVVVLPYTGDNDDWKEMTVSALTSKKRSVDDSNESLDEEGTKGLFMHNLMTPRQGKNRRASPEDENVYGMSGQKKRRRVGDFAEEGIDEGTTEQRDIQVGSDHQVSVPPFVPSQQSTIVSRNPVRMWKPDSISQEGTDDYIEQAAKILTPYLREHHLTQEEPYAPFPTKRMEDLSKLLSRKRLPTLSSVSSVSSLTSEKVDALREFNIDALLRNLHVSNYDVKAAIAAIEASPKDYLVAWSPHEKARFNAGFRRYSGSLRAIYKGMGNKGLSEVIDYHYRFKIPDQFRKVQERKREQAIRMLECIETKRHLNAPIIMSTTSTMGPMNGNSEQAKRKGDWSKTGSSSLAVSLEGRRAKAKELLLDVEAKLGRNKMLKVFEVFKNADETTLAECKTKLLEIFRGRQDFQTRFLEFLPQQLRL